MAHKSQPPNKNAVAEHLGLLYIPHFFTACQRAFLADAVHWKTVCCLELLLTSAASVLIHGELYGMA